MNVFFEETMELRSVVILKEINELRAEINKMFLWKQM